MKDLFLSLAVTVEDLMHDSSVVELIWTSCGDPTLIESVATLSVADAEEARRRLLAAHTQQAEESLATSSSVITAAKAEEE